MKIIDFDQHFFRFAQRWVAAHPGLTEQQIEDSYNSMMSEWMNTPADWLEGTKPAEYFERFSTSEELIGLMGAYSAQGVNLPEPLYSRIVALKETCEQPLAEIVRDHTRAESLRAEAMGMLRDMGSTAADDALLRMVCESAQSGELCDMAADILSTRGAETASRLLDRYDEAPDYGKTLILDICTNYPGDERVYTYLVHQLKNCPEQRALFASYLGKLGDERAIEPLRQLLGLFDLSYFDYIELRNAVELLGGDAGEERTFYGDPDYEAMRMQ